MGIETFPEIESFQKLPRQVLVKGGNATVDEREGRRLSGIVINNIGQRIKDIRVSAVFFDASGIPLVNTSATSDPDHLPQGGIGSFMISLPDHLKEYSKYHLYPNWRFDDR